MAYKATFDFTQKAQNEAKATKPLATPFAERDPNVPDATPETLPLRLREGLGALGWPGLMPVQAQAIPYILDARDLIVQSRTGSGKTGAFLLPMLERLDSEVDACQALVLCPTRELAKQIYDEFERMNAGLPEHERLRAVAVYGGTAYGPQLDAFKAGAHLVVGTPGRVLDHLSRGTLELSQLEMIVLDEADEMLSMGFYPDMMKLKRYLPKVRDGYMFSATMPFEVQRIGQAYLNDPILLKPQGGQVHVERMTHKAFMADVRQKDRALARLIEWENPASGIIFANTRREVDYLATFLTNVGLDAAAISSDLTQKAREEVMGRLREGRLRFLVATDVAARGIDVEDLSHVFHYDVPQDREYYVHRSGRTARAGKAGVSIAIVTAKDAPTLREIARRYDIPLEEAPVPTEDELAARVARRIARTVDLSGRSRLDRERQARFVPVARHLLDGGHGDVLAVLLDRLYTQALRDGRLPADLDEDAPADAAPPAPRSRKPAPPDAPAADFPASDAPAADAPDVDAAAPSADAADAPAKPARSRRPKAAEAPAENGQAGASASEASASEASASEASAPDGVAPEVPAKPARSRRRKAEAPADAAAPAVETPAVETPVDVPAKKPRTRRKASDETAAPVAEAPPADAPPEAAEAPAKKPRSRRKKAEPAPDAAADVTSRPEENVA